MNRRASVVVTMLALLTLLMVASVATGTEQETASTKRVLAPSGAVDQRTAGITLWHDYGAFALYRMTDAAYEGLSAETKLLSVTNAQLDRIELEGYPFDTQRETPVLADEWVLNSAEKGPSLHLVQFVGPIKQAWLDTLTSLNVTPVHYINSNAYLVWADAEGRNRLAQLVADGDFLQYSDTYQPQYKLGASLRERLVKRAYDADETVTVTIQIYNHADKEATEQLIESLSSNQISAWQPILAYQNIIVDLRAGDINTIANRADVYWIGERHPMELFDEVQGQIVAGNFNSGSTGPSGTGYLAWLNGFNFSTNPADYPIVDIVDDGIGNANAGAAGGDPTMRVNGDALGASRVAYISNCTNSANGEGIGGHGHININIAGGFDSRSGFPFRDPNGYQRGMGINPYGRFAGTRIFDPGFDQSACGSSDTGLIKSTQDDGAIISSNSWGCSGCAGSYDDSSQAYDVGVRDADQTEAGNQPMITVFSAGNSGSSGNTIGTPGNGKNVITVGASENARPTDEDGNWTDGCNVSPTGANSAMDVIGFSSRGPAPGGRTKPEIIAPGTHIQGTASTNSGYNGTGVCDRFRPSGQTVFASSSGTSHSAPAVAGVTSLYYYWLENTYGVSTPSPAMIKAYLIAHPTYLTGVDANDDLPSNNQGYGMPNLGIAFDEAARVLDDQTTVFDNTGEEFTWIGNVADPTKPVRIVMAYTDAAGAIGTSPEVNNLNLEATIGGTTYRGNNFTGQWSTAGGSLDADNNYEAIFLPAGASGTLEFTITAANIAGDGVPNSGDTTDQDFAIVCYNCSNVPTYTLSVSPATMSTCAGATPSYTVNVGQVAGFADPVSLSTLDVPLGLISGFSINPVTPIGSTSLDLDLANVAAGSYTFTVSADAGGNAQTTTVGLDIDPDVAMVSTPSLPANGSATANASPTLVWSAESFVDSYEVQIATDPAFVNIIESSSTNSNSYAVTTLLNDGDVYYWQVRSTNGCGTSDWSDLSVFRTLESNLACTNTYGPEGFESGVAGWTHNAGTGVDTWARVDTSANSGTFAFFAEDVNTVSDQYLVSPEITLAATTTQARFQFAHSYDLEATYDGGVLEYTVDGGSTWNDVDAANLLTTSYDDEISGSFSSPIAGRMAWTGANTAWRESIVNVDALIGTTVQFRFRLATDISVGDVGWWIDDVLLESCEPFSADADYSDLPAQYGAAWHLGAGDVRLGSEWTVDTEFTDGNDDSNDDVAINDIMPDSTRDILIPTNADGWVKVWFDWDKDLEFESSELVVNMPAIAGSNSYSVTSPANSASSGVPYRVRLFDSTTDPGVGPIGEAINGEVEDGYTIPGVATAIELRAVETSSTWPILLLAVMLVGLLTLRILGRRRATQS